MTLRKSGRAWSVKVAVGRVTIGFLVNGRTHFARWHHSDNYFGVTRRFGASIPRFSMAVIISPNYPKVIGR